MGTDRLSFIDVAKGLLILIVVIHHMPYVIDHLGIVDPTHETIHQCRVLYVTFFMPAFFVITGYCSRSAMGSFVTALIKNLKQIILPAFTLGAISVWIDRISHGVTDPIEYCKLGFSTLIFEGGPYWFLTALFVAKLIYWSVERFVSCNDSTKLLIYFAISIVGCLMHEFGIPEIWSVWHAFMLCIFLCVGRLLRQYGWHRNLFMGSALTFIVLTALCLIIGHQVPYVTANIEVHPITLPLYYLLALSGSILVLGLSRMIGECAVLQFYGRNSLIIYGLHIAILFVLYRIASTWLNLNTSLSLTIFISVFILTLAILYLFIRLLNLRYVRYAIGKF